MSRPRTGLVPCRRCRIPKVRLRAPRVPPIPLGSRHIYIDDEQREWCGLLCPACSRPKREPVAAPHHGPPPLIGLVPCTTCGVSHRRIQRAGRRLGSHDYVDDRDRMWDGLKCPDCRAAARAKARASPRKVEPAERFPTPEERAARKLPLNGITL